MSGLYKCIQCRTKYIVKNDIPDFCSDKLDSFKRMESAVTDDSARNYKEGYLATLRSEFYYTNFLKELNILAKDSIVLEVGCGSGNSSLKVLAKGLNLVSIDISYNILKILQNRVTSAGYKNTCFIMRADGEQLPFDDNTFDAIFTVATLHHLENPGQGIKEMRRCLKQNGLLIIGFEPSVLYYKIIRPARWIIKRLKRKKDGIESMAEKYALGFTHNFWIQMSLKYNLQLIRIKPVWFLIGFLHYFMAGFSWILSKKEFRIPYKLENFILNIDELLLRLPVIKNFCWHWNAIFKIPNKY